MKIWYLIQEYSQIPFFFFFYFFSSLENERGRQEQLARERIAARKKKLEEQRAKREQEKGDLDAGNSKEDEEKERILEEANKDEMDDLSEIEQLQREGTIYYLSYFFIRLRVDIVLFERCINRAVSRDFLLYLYLKLEIS